ncbi:calcium-binding protein [Acetobacter sacchari]|uniref:Calcium-binding protein n=1 Tax=Acetobacter sacchari TaxID=2661687 RepID=A0ABS3LSJ1_9PROT|nr:calcium-binding protein [Acetobacter sacchari]MBO1358876.1 calcium-binding protein [Acetobacter sacchari]
MTVRSIWTDPSDDGPNLLFNNGEVIGGVEQYGDTPSSIPGLFDSEWGVTQWRATEYFDPSAPIFADADDDDSILGTPIASWHEGAVSSANGNASLVVYNTPNSVISMGGGKYTYQLQAGGGALNDLYLQTLSAPTAQYTFDRSITFTAQERIAAISGDTGNASFGNQFVVAFNAPEGSGLSTVGLFLQLNLFDSRNSSYAQMRYSTLTSPLTTGEMFNVSPTASMITVASRATTLYSTEVETLPAKAQSKFSTVKINLNAALDQMISQIVQSDSKNARYYEDLSNWSLSQAFIGLESNASTDDRAGKTNTPMSATVDVSGIKITSDDSQAVTYASSVGSAIQTVSDVSQDDSWAQTATVAGGSASVNLTGSAVSNVQYITSNGDDAIEIGAHDADITANGTTLFVHGDGGDLTLSGMATITLSGLFDSLNATGVTIASSSFRLGDGVTLTDLSGQTITAGKSLSLSRVTDSTITTGSSAQLFSITGSTITMGTGSQIVSSNNNTIRATGDTSIFGGMNNTVTSDAGTFLFGSNTTGATFTSSGQIELVNPKGATTLIATGTSAPAAGGPSNVSLGAVSVFGSDTTNLTFISSVNALFVAGEGDEIMDASSSKAGVSAWASKTNPHARNVLIGGVYSDTLVGGDGYDILTGGAGEANTFVAPNDMDAGYIEITDFNGAQGNMLILLNDPAVHPNNLFTEAQKAAMLASQADVGGSTILSIQNLTIKLDNVSSIASDRVAIW